MIDPEQEYAYHSRRSLLVLALKIILGVLAAVITLSLIGEQLLPQ